MPNCHHNSHRGDRRAGELRRRLDALDSGQDGAVLLLCLAALLMLLLMSWALLDGIFVVQDKGEVQASADVAAYSQASVKARSMNMMAFTNVAKRSLVGVYATYDAMFNSFNNWLERLWASKVSDGICEGNEFPICDDAEWNQNWDLYIAERDNDHMRYQFNRNYYAADLRALDNYQEYLVTMTPWWGWSEAVIRAQRNGATLAASFPPPRMGDNLPFSSVADAVAAEAGGTGGFVQRSSMVEKLPVQRDEFWEGMWQDGMQRDEFRNWEHDMNVAHHQQRSEFGAASTEVISRGAGEYFEGKMDDIDGHRIPVYEQISQFGTPWTLLGYGAGSEARWLFESSNLIMTYRHQPEYFDGMVDKYERIGEDVEVGTSSATQQIYRPTGYWGLARSEISYQAEDEPNLWRPVWTARMRPVALPNEFRDAGHDLPMMYRVTVNYLLLSAEMHSDISGQQHLFYDDLVYFERAARAMGQSTIEGVAR